MNRFHHALAALLAATVCAAPAQAERILGTQLEDQYTRITFR
jgi:hypothetical protein